MSEVRTNEVVNVVEVMERNTAVCLVSFKPWPEKLNEMNELSEAQWSCMQRSGIQRNGAEGSERMKFAFLCEDYILLSGINLIDAINNRKCVSSYYWKSLRSFLVSCTL